MKFFLKLHVISMLYALIFFVPIELMLNVYRINRLTNWEFGTINMLTGTAIIVEFVIGTILIILLTKKWLDGRKASFWTILLWLPYLVLLVYLFAVLFPMTHREDEPNPVTGLLAIGGLMIYPFYILILNFSLYKR